MKDDTINMLVEDKKTDKSEAYGGTDPKLVVRHDKDVDR